ncbi:hypothetical protein K1719_045177 [Acacia pycnantha]|nr:hypothetical protein K1719_045177 [Acacia pycnantha]
MDCMLRLGCFWIRCKIKQRIDEDAFRIDDPEGSEYAYPMALVQIPMCNERKVYEQSISVACQINWPRDRLLIQVVDDSDDESIWWLINEEAIWR